MTVEVERTTDASLLNFVANHPDVRDGLLLGPGKQLDYGPVLADLNNVALVGEFGGMVFHRLVPGFFEVHSQVLKPGRGQWTLEMGQSALQWMFTHTNATEIMTRVPEGNKGALNLTLNLGGVQEHTIPNAVTVHGRQVGWTIYRLTIHDWIRTAPGLEEVGEAFHTELHRQYREQGRAIVPHPQDPWHDRHVGAAFLMFAAGQPMKGVGYYNRWAAMAVAPQARLLSVEPDVVLDIREARLLMRDGRFSVLRDH